MAVKHGLVWDGYHFIPIAKEDYFNYMKTGVPTYWEIEFVPQEWEDELREEVHRRVKQWKQLK